MKFDTSTAKAQAEERQAQELARRTALLWKLLPVLLLLIVSFFLARVIGKHIRRPVAALPGGGAIDVSIGEEGIVPLHATDAHPSDASALTPAQRNTADESSLEEEMARAIRERTQPELLEIQRFAKNKPEHVAALLKNWINE
ncbi:MAG: hypothetical protein C4336_08365 [Armatimonadota bacterium]